MTTSFSEPCARAGEPLSFVLPAGLLFCLALLAACRSTPPPRGANTSPAAETRPSEHGTEVEQPPAEGTDKRNSSPKQPTVEDSRPDAKGRPVRTSFYGAELIREKVLADGIPTTRITIRGGAVLRHNDVVIYAPRIELDGGTRGRCLGGVRIVDAKNALVIRAGRADYNRDLQTLSLDELPVMTMRRDKTAAPVVITSTRMIRHMGEHKSVLAGDVRILQKPWPLLADAGVYFDEGDHLELDNSPVLLGPDGFMTANTISYFVKDRFVRLETRVVLLTRNDTALPGVGAPGGIPSLEEFSRSGGQLPAGGAPASHKPKEVNEGKEEDARPPGVLSGDRLEYRFPKEGLLVVQVDGNVRLSQKDMRLTTDHMRAEGKDFQQIIADRSVRMLERKNNIRVNAGRMVYDRAAGLLRLDREPRMEFLKKDTTIVTAELTAQVIERDVKSDRTTARGDVRIVRGATEATGAQADYDRRGDVILVEGAPSLVRGKSRVACEQIFIFPSRNRVLLKNRITGTLLE